MSPKSLAALLLLGSTVVACESAPYAGILEGKACTPEGTCAAGYTCVSDRCVSGSDVGAGTSAGGGQPDGGASAGELGAICSGPDACTSGHCVDGVCCEEACAGGCMSCTATFTGAQAGECRPIVIGEDPDLECPTTETCNGEGACGFSCGQDPTPPGGACPGVCTGGCPNGTCVIACDGAGACENDTLACPAGFACSVECAADNACRGATVECPSRYACEVDCMVDCQGLKVECSTGICTVSCWPGAICQGADLFCAGNSCAATCNGNDVFPNVDCGTACACETCKLVNGEACTASAQCESGNCPAQDDMCCDTQCSGACRSCDGALTGQADGVCNFIPAGQDPADECNGSNLCNGSGACG